MSAAGSNFKKQKTFHQNKSSNFYHQKTKKKYLEAGHHGFLATCNFREKDCVRECYNLLNEYADELYGPNEITDAKQSEEQTTNEPPKEVDISDALDQAIDKTKKQAKQQNFRFQLIDTGANNCLFIKTTLQNPTELGVKIVEDIAVKKLQKTRYLLRLIPIEVVCKANIKDIIDAIGPQLDKYFLNAEKTYSVVFNKRYNNAVNRTEVINELAELVTAKGIKNKVDLKNSELCIIVEVIKGLCLMSIVPNFHKWKKYNLVELALGKEQEKCDEEQKSSVAKEGKDDSDEEQEIEKPENNLKNAE